ncbi:MAG: hypothetical protein LBM12_00785 [Candidatus Nomurabacteria bacterium]|jgi:type II secretory pathway pseudopilin PulG|nr:hypothetical protein [Candidatus Nomurabacteria bacterium]
MSRLKGETIVEVMFAVAIFGVVAIVAIQIMNRGTVTAQAAIEAQQARNEMDAQAAAIKFIHDSFVAERGYPDTVRQFETIWDEMTRNPRISAPLLHPDDDSCNFAINDSAASAGSFIINTRALQANATNIIRRPNNTTFTVPTIYPRVVYNSPATELSESAVYDQVVAVEGLQVFAVESSKKINGQPEYYDFHIRACWRAAGQNSDSKLSTITRTLNPKVIE